MDTILKTNLTFKAPFDWSPAESIKSELNCRAWVVQSYAILCMVRLLATLWINSRTTKATWMTRSPTARFRLSRSDSKHTPFFSVESEPGLGHLGGARESNENTHSVIQNHCHGSWCHPFVTLRLHICTQHLCSRVRVLVQEYEYSYNVLNMNSTIRRIMYHTRTCTQEG
jgi:hypothetical protein